MHERVDPPGLVGVLAAQRRVGPAGQAVGLLGVAVGSQRAQRVGQDGGERLERRPGLNGAVGRHEIVFTI